MVIEHRYMNLVLFCMDSTSKLKVEAFLGFKKHDEERDEGKKTKRAHAVSER
jgi:hypothetical protein